MTCEHPEFGADVVVNRLQDTTPVAFTVNITITCMECGVAMRFLGLPCGVDLNGAAVSADGTEARLAIAPEGEVRALIDGPSFTVRGRPVSGGDPQ